MNANAVPGIALQIRCRDLLQVPSLVSWVLIDEDADSVVAVRVNPDDVASTVTIPISEMKVATIDLSASWGSPEVRHPGTPVRLASRDVLLSSVRIDCRESWSQHVVAHRSRS
jgi:hypothetical protein